MDGIVAFFDQLTVVHKAASLSAVFALFWTLEAAGGAPRQGKVRHARTNLFFWAWTVGLNLAFAGILAAAAVLAGARGFGLLHAIELPLALQVLVTFVLMDLIAVYLHHRLMHALPALWRLHLVHHSDTRMDFTTALRHHPLEAMVRIGFSALAILIIGAPLWLLTFYQAVTLLFAQWIHSDTVLPEPVERVLSKLFVTPRFHRVHHHQTLPFTDSNFGTVFSVWDRLFGTLRTKPREEIVYGVDTLSPSVDWNASALRLFLLRFHDAPANRALPDEASSASR